MTFIPVYVRQVGYPRWCRLRCIGSERHTTACGATLASFEPVEMRAGLRYDDIQCTACDIDLAAKRSRRKTVDLRPRARDLETLADVEAKED